MIWGAAYSLWMYKRVYLGDVTHDARRRTCRTSIAVSSWYSVFWRLQCCSWAIYPKPFTDVIDPSVQQLLQHVGPVQASLKTRLNREIQMIDNISWLAVYPEIILMVMGCVIVLADLGVSSFRAVPAPMC